MIRFRAFRLTVPRVLLLLAISFVAIPVHGQRLRVGVKAGGQIVATFSAQGERPSGQTIGGSVEIGVTENTSFDLSVMYQGAHVSRRDRLFTRTVLVPAPPRERTETSRARSWEVPLVLKRTIALSDDRGVFFFGGLAVRHIDLDGTLVVRVATTGEVTEATTFSEGRWAGGAQGGFGLDLPAWRFRVRPEIRLSGWSKPPSSVSSVGVRRFNFQVMVGVVFPR